MKGEVGQTWSSAKIWRKEAKRGRGGVMEEISSGGDSEMRRGTGGGGRKRNGGGGGELEKEIENEKDMEKRQ